MDETSVEEYHASMRGRHSQRKGKRGEDVAELLLRSKGVRMVEQIATPIIITASRKMRGRMWYQIVWGTKVSGDRRGVLPGGRRVLAEVKARDRNLRWSDFEAHQVAALDENHELGGLSLVVYVHPDVNAVMRWPIPGFAPYQSITPEEAPQHEWAGLTNE